MLKLFKFIASSFKASAACSALSAVRHNIEAHASGEATEYIEYCH